MGRRRALDRLRNRYSEASDGGGASAWRSVPGAASVTASACRWCIARAAGDGSSEKGGSSPFSSEAKGGPNVDPQVGPCRRDRGSGRDALAARGQRPGTSRRGDLHAARVRRRGAGHPQQLLPRVLVGPHRPDRVRPGPPQRHQAQLKAINGAIKTWNSVLQECFDGLISLTQVSSRQEADIVVHYVPTAGGVVFGGYAICGDHGCPNILVRSDLPPSLDRDPYDPEYLGWVTLHELGHALGLGHATNLEESTDLMGYGWPELGDPVLSQCDVNALAFVFAWALEGSDPYPPAEGPYVCDTA